MALLALSLSGVFQPVLAQAEPQVRRHELKFYLDPALAPDLSRAMAVLPKYVEDLNAILAKNTSRRLVFDPAADLVLTGVQPFSGQAAAPLPLDEFEIWVYVTQSGVSYSYGGYASLDSSGAGVVAGMRWTQLYDPDALAAGAVSDYWTQINNTLHELAHVFGAGIGEYYKLATIQDLTGVEPALNIDLLDPIDPFWSAKADFLADPLLRNAANSSGAVTRAALREYVQFSALTAAVFNGDYRNGLPTVDLQKITLTVLDENGAALADANVKIWSITGNSSYQAGQLLDTHSDAAGQVVFAWGGSANPHNNYDFLRLIKVYKDGYFAAARYVSIFDADSARLVEGENELQLGITLREDNQPPAITSLAPVRPGLSATGMQYTLTFSEPVAGVDAGDFVLETTGTLTAEIGAVSGDGSQYSVRVETGGGSGTLRLQVQDNDSIVDARLIPLGGAGLGNGSFTSADAYSFGYTQVFIPLVMR